MSELLFHDLELGKEYPPFECELTQDMVSNYIASVEDEQTSRQRDSGKAAATVAPPSIASVYFLQAYYQAFADRPKGNIHAKQKFKFRHPVHIGDKLTTTLTIEEKYIKKERNYVLIGIKSSNQHGITVMTGVMTLIWAR